MARDPAEAPALEAQATTHGARVAVTGTAATDPAAMDARPPRRPPSRGRLPAGHAAAGGRQRLVARLPERPLVAAADLVGELWYRVAPARRAQARANLARVCEGLAASGRGSAAARRAATDPDALERLVRAAFRHGARYYLEVRARGCLRPR